MPEETFNDRQLDPPADESTLTASAGLAQAQLTARPGDRFGRYKLLEEIGQGGCGAVFVADQEEPVRRRVALKVIKLGMDTRQVIARFEAERQALAMMDHPNIAKVLDAGSTDTGRPFFVMELVRGIRITDYCDQNKLSAADRLKLFIQVCQAVQHAHQKGIIHRDLKPSNILVTLQDGVPVPKVIDFGIAKATANQKLTDKTVYTAFEQFIGTPAYMSPEQAEMTGLDIDTRSDIYSLGVLLYELLIGETPFSSEELLGVGLDAMRRILREKDPARPSAKLSTMTAADLTAIALHRQSEPPRLIKSVRGDLDWIVMKCLEKERTRRYETANGLAMDIQRYLSNEPVAARPPSKLYEFQKTVRRHKVGFAATAAIIVVLLAGVLVSTWQAVRATHAQANEAKQKAAAQQALYDSLLGQARTARLAQQLGYRDRVFDLLEQAWALDVPQKNLTDLRNEAVACLGNFVGLAPATFADFPTNIESACLAPSGKLAAFGLSDGTIQVREMPSGRELARLTATNGWGDSLCFDSTGDQLFLVHVPTPPESELGWWMEDLAMLFESLPSCRLYSWTCSADGRWQPTGNRALPGAWHLFDHGTETFASVFEVGLLAPGEVDTRYATFRQFSVTTGAFVDGYQVTNALPAHFRVWPAATPDGQLIAAETWDTRNPNSSAVVNLYDWQTGRRINQLRLPALGSVTLSPDGKYLAWFSLGAGGGAIYSVPGLERIGQFKENFLFFATAVFSHNRVALPISQQNRILLWNLATGGSVALLDEPEVTTPVAFSADGNSLLTSGDHHARLYRLDAPEKLDLASHAAAVPGIAFSPDGRQLASVGKDRVVRVCDAETGRVLWETNDLPGAGQCLGYSPDGRWLATGDFDTDLIEIRDARTGRRLLEIETKARRTWSTQFSPDGRYLATGGHGIRIYKIGDNRGSLKATLVKSSAVAGLNLLFTPDGRSLEFEENGPALFLFVWDFDKSPQPANLDFLPPRGVETESFTPDGHLVVIDRNGRIVTLELPTGKEISFFQARKPSHDISAGICLSRDGSRLAVTSESQRGVDIWDFKAGKRLYSLPDEAGTVYWLTWSPDGRRLTIARDNGNIAIWNLDTVGQILTRLGLNP